MVVILQDHASEKVFAHALGNKLHPTERLTVGFRGIKMDFSHIYSCLDSNSENGGATG